MENKDPKSIQDHLAPAGTGKTDKQKLVFDPRTRGAGAR